MTKRIFALLVFLGAGAQAHEVTTRSDGCVLLDQIIYEEVTAAAWGVTGAELALTQMDEPDVVVCRHTVQTVSKAFTTAMQMTGALLPIDPDMEGCMNGDLTRCFETPDPFYPITELPDSFSAMNSWKAVRDTAIRAMPEGASTDKSEFSPDAIRKALRLAVNRH